jgi:hypothetical protein
MLGKRTVEHHLPLKGMIDKNPLIPLREIFGEQQDEISSADNKATKENSGQYQCYCETKDVSTIFQNGGSFGDYGRWCLYPFLCKQMKPVIPYEIKNATPHSHISRNLELLSLPVEDEAQKFGILLNKRLVFNSILGTCNVDTHTLPGGNIYHQKYETFDGFVKNITFINALQLQRSGYPLNFSYHVKEHYTLSTNHFSSSSHPTDGYIFYDETVLSLKLFEWKQPVVFQCYTPQDFLDLTVEHRIKRFMITKISTSYQDGSIKLVLHPVLTEEQLLSCKYDFLSAKDFESATIKQFIHAKNENSVNWMNTLNNMNYEHKHVDPFLAKIRNNEDLLYDIYNDKFVRNQLSKIDPNSSLTEKTIPFSRIGEC